MGILRYGEFIKEVFNTPKSTNTTLAKWDTDQYNKYYLDIKKDYDLLYKHEDFQRIWKILQRDCMPFLEELSRTKSDLIFRGMGQINNNAGWGIEKLKSFKNRDAKDMDISVQKLFDEKFFYKFKERLRSDGVFTTKDPIQAKTYSSYSKERKRNVIYLFFPIGQYKYYWNPKIYDLYTEIENHEWYSPSKSRFLDGEDDIWYDDLWYKTYGEPIQKNQNDESTKLRMRHINTPITTGGGKGKYSEDGVWIPDKSKSEYNEEIRNNLLSIRNSDVDGIVNGYKTDSIEEAGNNEITFICNEYYLVDDAFLYKILKKISLIK